jgi:hypothetical protein
VELVNSTPVVTRVSVGDPLGATLRPGCVTAKATFRVVDGHAELDTQSPVPLFDVDVTTEVGLLPRDDIPRRDDRFEVVLVGRAYAPTDVPVEESEVTLAVGDEARTVRVVGDRVWDCRGDTPRISAPEPFTTMPLTFDRTFGGSVRVEVDDGAFVLVPDAQNPFGKGFDATAQVMGLASALGCPAGYPRWDETRHLPNLEDPEAPIRRWDDAPAPHFFGAIPVECGFFLRAQPDAPGAVDAPRAPTAAGDVVARPHVPRLGLPPTARCHPTWRIAAPAPGSEVRLTGARPAGQVMRFSWPRLGVAFDYSCGERTGARALVPQSLVLLPEEERFYVVYRHSFLFHPRGERCVRVRLESA